MPPPRHGRLGRSTAREQTPQRVPALAALGVVALACGKAHTLVLTRRDEVAC